MIELYKEKKDCCGCTACMNICAQSAIEMMEDQEGFKYPQIDISKCVSCGICKKVCAFQNEYNLSKTDEKLQVYAVKHVDEVIRMSSSSGGVFTAIADYVLGMDGFVYGAAFDKEMTVVHKRAKTKEERDKFKGSKYVQSDLKDIFKQVKEDIQDEKYVLFTGTPCQVAGLKSYLGKIDISKLILCDIVCHGVPSPLMWKEHIMLSEKKTRSTIKEYYCRSKINGWHNHNELSIYENGKVDYLSPLSQKHKNLFYSHNILRPSCHSCKYANLHRVSDITMADFWGIEKSMPEFDDNRGISLVLVNTEKGGIVFNNIKSNLIFRESSITDCLQPQLQYPSKPSPKREEFWNDYEQYGYVYVIKKYAGYTLTSCIKDKIVCILQKGNLLNFVKKILGR